MTVGQSKISINDAALYIGVSTATIRNWIKTGYLEKVGKNYVSIKSLEKFHKEVAGIDKLNKRANKSQRDSHDHGELTELFLKKLKQGDIFDLSTLAQEYEDSLSNSFRNKEGIYYTPSDIVDDLIDFSKIDTDNAVFCDPCCGSGNFIIAALGAGIKPMNVYGYDTDPIAVEITKKRIYEKTGYKSDNIKVGDFLELVISGKNRKFDCIFTNPPWGKKLPINRKKRIASYFGIKSSLDTSALFFFACMKLLKDNGILGLLLPESFFNITTFEEARSEVLRYKIKRVIDYGKPFKGLITKAQGLVIEKAYCKDDKYKIECCHQKNIYIRTVGSFRNNPKKIINLYCSYEDEQVISHLFSIPHLTLKNNGKWALGIVTGNNKKFIINKRKQGYIPVYKGSDITRKGLKPVSSYIPSDLSLYQQVAPIEFYQADEKLVYKFISSELCFFYDTGKRYFLNSANILIPNKAFPVKTEMLGELLSSKFMNWLFKKLFNTHKILRGDLELLPIHVQFLEGANFDEDRYIANLGLERTDDGTYRVKK